MQEGLPQALKASLPYDPTSGGMSSVPARQELHHWLSKAGVRPEHR